MISVGIRYSYLVPIIMLLFVTKAANTAPIGDYQGWLWETGVTNLEQDEEFCFAREDFAFAAGLTWSGGTTGDVCWGRRTTSAGRTLFNFPHSSSTFLEQSTRPLVSAGSNLYEMYGEDVIGGIGQGEERLGTILTTPTDDNLLLLGGYEANDLTGREYFSFLDVLVKNTASVRDARLDTDLFGTWRIGSYGRLLENIDREAAEVAIHTLDLNPIGACSFSLSGILAPDGFTDNADFFGARYSDDGNDFVNRDLKAEVIHEHSSLCTYVIDGNGYLAITRTVTPASDPGNPTTDTVRYLVADNNNFLVYAPDGGGLSDEPQNLAVGFRAAAGMTSDDIDGTFLFYLPMNDYEASGTGHSAASTDTQESDSFGRGKIVFDSTQTGTVPPGEGGNWSGCDMELQLNEEQRVLSGVASNTTASVTSLNSADDIKFATCDYSLDADGGLRLWLTLAEPDGTITTDIIVRGYVDATRELLSMLDFAVVNAAGGKQDSAESAFVVAIKYAGDPNADADGDGLTNYQEFKIPLAPSHVRGDIDGDGSSDILWRNSVTGQNWLYLMAGATIDSSVGVNTVPTVWEIVGNGDYNNDGNADILWRNSSTGQNWMYLMIGATIDSSVGINTVSDTNWKVVGSGDYNGDGNADILWRNSVTGQNWMYQMNGATIDSSAGVNTVSDLNWQIASDGDYNGDGNADILWRNSSTGQNWLYVMNGATIDSSVGVNTVPTVWQIVGDGDYNGNGTADILWRNSSTGQNWMYLMIGATIDSSTGVNTVSDLNWKVVGDGDYNGDRNADILWRNSSTGQNWLYVMNGATIDSSVGVNTVPTAWQIVNVN